MTPRSLANLCSRVTLLSYEQIGAAMERNQGGEKLFSIAYDYGVPVEYLHSALRRARRYGKAATNSEVAGTNTAAHRAAQGEI